MPSFTTYSRETASVMNTRGVSGNAGEDQGAAINNAITAAAALGYSDLYFPDGTYDTTVPIVQLPGVTLKLTKNAIVRATAAMSSLIQTPAAQPLFDVGIYGGRLHCNDLADTGLDAQWFQEYFVHDTYIENFLSTGARFGLAGTPYSSFQAVIMGLKTFRGAGTIAAGSRALHLRAATDCKVGAGTVLSGGETGLLCNSGGHWLHQIHAWNRATTGNMLIGFDDQAGTNDYIGCFADTPYTAGWRVAYGNVGVGFCRTYMNPLFGNDNTADGILYTATDPNGVVEGFKCIGGDATHRFKSDINYSAVTARDSLALIGNRAKFSVTVAPTLIPTVSQFDALVTRLIDAATGVARFDWSLDGSDNMNLKRRDASGALLGTPFSVNVSSGQVSMTDAGVTVAGTWNKPLTIGGANYWTNATSAKLYAKAVASGAPASDVDGTVVGTQT